MRKLLATLSTIAMVGTLFVGAPAPAVAADGDTTIGSAKVSDHSGDTNIVHVADALETAGQDQLYLVDPSSVISLHLDMTSADASMDDGIVDNFTLTLANGSFGANFTDIRVADGTCDLAWTNTSTTVRSGAIDCDEDGADGHEISVLFFVTAPATGSAVLTVTDAGSTFKVYFMAEEEDDDIYVGQDADLAAGAGSCGAAGPDFSTTNVTQDLDVQQAIDFALQSINEDGDTVIVCDGTYGYEGDMREYLGSDLYDGTLTVRAQNSGSVTLDGDGDDRLLRVVGADLSVEGIHFFNGYSNNGGAIYVGAEDVDPDPEDVDWVGGSLEVLDATFNGNLASSAGGAIDVDGSLTVNHTEFNANDADYGGAIYVDGDHYIGDQVIISDVEFSGNNANDAGGALYSFENSISLLGDTNFQENTATWGGAVVIEEAEATVTGSRFVNNSTTYESDEMAADYGGAALYLYGGTLEVNESIFVGNSTPGTSAGAGIHVYVGSLNVDDSIFRGNRAGQGPAIYSYGSGLDDDWDDGEEIVITGSEFRANVNVALEDSGAIAHERNGRDFIVTGNSFASNSGATFGGAIETWLVDGLTEITGNVFTGNSAREGGALWIDVRNGVADIHSNRFNRNRARTGGAISFECETDAPRTVTRLLSRSNRYSSNTASAPKSSANVWSSRYVDSAEDCN